jgi:serine/threonine-protein kinase PRP4
LLEFAHVDRHEDSSRLSEKYEGLSRTLVPARKEEDENEVDMFASEEEAAVGEEEVGGQAVTDESGYYIVYSGKAVGSGKYRLAEKVGKGVFGVVARAVDGQGQQVALKVLRKNEMMVASGEHEFRLLSRFRKSDHIVGLRDFFFEEGHLFLVAELMGPDLRSWVRKNQDKVSLESIRQYGIAMFLSLHELQKHRIIHADIKPDNFLLTLDLAKIKLTDFGTAFSVDEYSREVDELVARYYRAPEVILGCELAPEQRFGIDVWAVGCSLYELFTGQFLFEGSSNNDMLRLMMETRGRFSIKMLKKCLRLELYFDQEFTFLHEFYDPNTKNNVTKKLQISITPERDLLNLLRKHERYAEDPRRLATFRDFLEGCLALNPKNRFTPEQAFQHPFLNHMVKLS